MANRIVSVHGFMGWGYIRLCCHLVGSRSLIDAIIAATFQNQFEWKMCMI